VSVVLDASAVLVLLLDEPGAEVVATVVSSGVLSAVNLAEVLSELTDRGADVSRLADDLVAAGVLVSR
jgi:PIN domain nuclease of toxin-antitoxin system